jgi:propionyl-CoA synthetase
MPARYGSCAMPVPGFQIHILDAMGNELPPHILGDMVIQLPLPPGTLQTIYNDDERYRQEYLTKHPGYYDTGDAAYKDDDGFVYIMGRTDDVINTAGHRLSTGAMEEILMEHPNVSECAVIPVKDDIKGQVRKYGHQRIKMNLSPLITPGSFAFWNAEALGLILSFFQLFKAIGFVICNAGTTADEYTTICSELVQLVREEMGPVASFKKVAIVNKLPKTRSGKILRGTMTKIANGQDYKITPTIEDPAIFDYLAPEIVNLMKR